jgi:hypothetical protein
LVALASGPVGGVIGTPVNDVPRLPDRVFAQRSPVAEALLGITVLTSGVQSGGDAANAAASPASSAWGISLGSVAVDCVRGLAPVYRQSMNGVAATRDWLLGQLKDWLEDLSVLPLEVIPKKQQKSANDQTEDPDGPQAAMPQPAAAEGQDEGAVSGSWMPALAAVGAFAAPARQRRRDNKQKQAPFPVL